MHFLIAKPMKSESYKLGKDGEQLASAFLKQQGYSILEERWHLHHLEIDIIAMDNKSHEIVFVEVKTRASMEYGAPEEAVDNKKIIRCVRAADAYLKLHHCNIDWRFDIISVIDNGHDDVRIDHIKEAFYPPLG